MITKRILIGILLLVGLTLSGCFLPPPPSGGHGYGHGYSYYGNSHGPGHGEYRDWEHSPQGSGYDSRHWR
jgi:hypothetical protein